VESLKRYFVLAWLFFIGTNVLAFYSAALPLQSVLILGGVVYIALFHRRQAMRLLAYSNYLLVLFLFSAPIPLMLLSARDITRGDIASQLFIALVFVVACVIAVRPEMDGIVLRAAFAIVALNLLVNVYALVTGNPLLSVAGRSSGFYTNPNLSGEAILGFALVFLSTRAGRLSGADFSVAAMAAMAIFATFSRTGAVASLVLLTAAIVLRARPEQVPKIVMGTVGLALVTAGFAWYVVNNVDISKDAATRITSLVEGGGVGDYQVDRGVLALEWLEVFFEKPLFGSGVNTIFEAPNGPHNMFLAMAVDYGLIGLAVYLLVMIRLTMAALRGDRHSAAPILLYVGWLFLFSWTSHNLLFNAPTIPLAAVAVARAYRIRYNVEAAS
jgi:O-antigen ligase